MVDGHRLRPRAAGEQCVIRGCSAAMLVSAVVGS
jgi:hypothetical protein